MKEQIDCPTCGALLVKRVTERGVTPVDSDTEVQFRRTTDYVICKHCMALFSVRDIAELAGVDEPPAEQEADVIMLLERMAERKRPAR
ncbi:MAG TPA: hypothetical protein VGB52_05580 [Actinomycetota bacterium]